MLNLLFFRLKLLSEGITDLTPQEISTKLFCTSEGERRKTILNWINLNKVVQQTLKSKALEFNKTGTSIGKENALVAIKEFKELDNEKKVFTEIIKEKWHPLPEIHEKEIEFKRASLQEK